MNRKLLLMYLGLFVVAILSVLNVLDVRIVLALTILGLVLFDRANFLKIDYALLATFVVFFVFVGNVGRIEAVRFFISSLMQGRELLVAVLASQIISNVPAAIMLSGFTEQVRELLLGVNIGGLGTIIASLASLISFKLYSKSEGARPLQFLGVFTLVNIGFLLALCAFI